jgi:hypothetical protein
MCMYYLRLLIGIIEEREFEERTTKDFLFKTPDGKKTEENGYTTDINTRYDKKKRTKESRKERETKERKEIKR